MVAMLIGCGLRRAELLALSLESIHALTPPGRRQLNEELAQWRRMSRAINLVLEASVE
jgi:hypothetical protein